MVRSALGAGLVWLGRRLLSGREDEGPTEAPAVEGEAATPPHDDSDGSDGEREAIGTADVAVVLSDEARRMILSAEEPSTAAPTPAAEAPLRGSLQERVMMERAKREMGGS